MGSPKSAFIERRNRSAFQHTYFHENNYLRYSCDEDCAGKWLRGEKGITRKNEKLTLRKIATELYDNVGDYNDGNL